MKTLPENILRRIPEDQRRPLGTNATLAHSRIRKGMDAVAALTTPDMRVTR